ncbi:MAG: pilin [Pseudomonadales bacterium]
MKLRPSSLLCAAIISAGASFTSTTFAQTTNIAPAMQLQSLTRQAWLRESLPDSTIFYARVPSLWGGFSYKEDSFKYALGNPQSLAAANSIQGAANKWVQQADAQISPLLTLLTDQLDGPIEIAAIANGPIPQVLATVPLSFTSTAQLQQLIDALVANKVVQGEAQPMQDGAGQLLTQAGPVPYRWDGENQRLNLLVSFGGAATSALDASFAALNKNPDNPMLENEQQMDDSHQGLYLWFNNQQALPLYKNMAPQHVMQQLTMFGVPEMKSLALSMGVQNTKGRLKLQLDAPNKGMLRQMIPINENDLDIPTAGTPKLTVLLSLPSAAQFNALEQMVASVKGPAQKYQENKAQLATFLGFSVEEFLDAVGPEVSLISDNSGEYLAVGIRDHQAFEALLGKIVAKPDAEQRSAEIAGAQINHLKLPSLFPKEAFSDADDVPFALRDILTKGSTHLYWKNEGDHLIISELPQILGDRERMLGEQSLSTWLEETQRQDLSGSSLAITGSIEQAPRRIYYGYLVALQYLADITGAEIDAFALPSAQDLNLAERGVFGLQIDSSSDKLGLELVYESSPADILLTGGSAGAIAAAGIIGAVAMPAYDDYAIKAKASGAMIESAMQQTLVEDFYRENGRFPNAEEAAQINTTIVPSNGFSVAVAADSGKIVTTFEGKNYKVSGKTLTYTPEVTIDSLQWNCTSTLRRSMRPAGCKRYGD